MASTFGKDAALALIKRRPGISDRELAEAAFGTGTSGLTVNDICRQLAAEGHIRRRLRDDGWFGNYPVIQPSAGDEAMSGSTQAELPTEERATEAKRPT